jgi:hypothetical protein
MIMREIKRGLLGCLFLPMLIVLTTASTGPAQETRPEQSLQAAPAASETPKPQDLVNTSGKVRLSLQGAAGFGFDRVDITTTSGKTVSISGGGGAGVGVGIAFGLSRIWDLDLELGGQSGWLASGDHNAQGSFSRGYLLMTLKYKKPTSDTGQFKFGAGVGSYYGGKLMFKRTDVNFDGEIDYDPAIGFHFTGEFERFIKPNLSVNIGAKIYFVEYEAKTYKVNSAELPLSALKDEVRNLNGSGMDFLLGINLYFD